MSLLNQTCKPPRVGDSPLSPEQAEQMHRDVPDWTLDGAAIKREFQFKGFREAMAFVNAVADLAEGQGHHPDIFISYKTVRLALTTHKIGGLSRNDFIVAAKIDQLQAFPPFGRANQS
jgi:4a-hydroxytetrahydrobiopterin dehydratase